MSDLQERHCVPCEGGIPPLDRSRAEALLRQVNSDWELSEDGLQITRTFRFKSYYKTIGFVNAVAWIANSEDHHPDMEVGYSRCLVRFTTHAIKGLSDNDFICAAKIDALAG